MLTPQDLEKSHTSKYRILVCGDGFVRLESLLRWRRWSWCNDGVTAGVMERREYIHGCTYLCWRLYPGHRLLVLSKGSA